jgi:hypothetical protein
MICAIYEFLNVKDTVKFSAVNSYIYDCRPIDEINHRKRMNPVIDSINSIRHIIIKWKSSGYDVRRFIGSMESMYKYDELHRELHCFKENNIHAEYQRKYDLYAEFRYIRPVFDKARHTEVNIRRLYNGGVYMIIR